MREATPNPIANLMANRHKVSDNEFKLLLLLKLDEQSADDVFRLGPAKELDAIRTWVAELPVDSDEDGWAKSWYVRCVSYAPWVTPDEIEAIQKAERKRFREAVRIFRARDNQPRSGGI